MNHKSGCTYEDGADRPEGIPGFGVKVADAEAQLLLHRKAAVRRVHDDAAQPLVCEGLGKTQLPGQAIVVRVGTYLQLSMRV